jgi:ketosteroid isomerase-like protein
MASFKDFATRLETHRRQVVSTQLIDKLEQVVVALTEFLRFRGRQSDMDGSEAWVAALREQMKPPRMRWTKLICLVNGEPGLAVAEMLLETQKKKKNSAARCQYRQSLSLV